METAADKNYLEGPATQVDKVDWYSEERPLTAVLLSIVHVERPYMSTARVFVSNCNQDHRTKH